ncbi:MAG: DUF4258 domain-containing protein [bacterium]
MNYSLSKHAKNVIQERKIPIEYLERVVGRPERIEPDRENPELEHRLSRIPECGNRVLRVVLKQSVEPALIITAFFDRKMRGAL